MREAYWPDFVKVADWQLTVVAHSRGGEGQSGHYNYARGPGARLIGSVSVVPMATADALEFRAFLHSLRGRGGTFLMRPPYKPGNRRAIYTDGKKYDDGTVYTDTVVAEEGALAADAAADAATINVGTLSGSTFMAPGRFLRVGPLGSGGQLVRVVSLAGNIATIRPRLRNAYPTGTVICVGRPLAEFRINGEVPAVPLRFGRSLDMQIAIREAY